MKTNNAKRFLRAAGLLAVAVFGGSILAQAQTLTTIHSFPSNPSDGQEPYPQHLAIDSQGAVYGTTVTGGSTRLGEKAHYGSDTIRSRHPRKGEFP